jgi:hypothetical protein
VQYHHALASITGLIDRDPGDIDVPAHLACLIRGWPPR